MKKYKSAKPTWDFTYRPTFSEHLPLFTSTSLHEETRNLSSRRVNLKNRKTYLSSQSIYPYSQHLSSHPPPKGEGHEE